MRDGDLAYGEWWAWGWVKADSLKGVAPLCMKPGIVQSNP